MLLPWQRIIGHVTPVASASELSVLPYLSHISIPLRTSLLPISTARYHTSPPHTVTRPHPHGSLSEERCQTTTTLCRSLSSLPESILNGRCTGFGTRVKPANKYGCGLVHCHGNQRSLARDAAPPNSLSVHVTEFDIDGNYKSKVLRKAEILFKYQIQARDIRFSTFSSLFVRANSIIIRLQHIKAIINSDSVVLLDSDHHSIQDFLPELQQKILTRSEDELPFEFVVLEAMLMEMFSVLDDRLKDLEPALREVLNRLLDPQIFSVDRGELHILLHHSKSLSEFHSIMKDIEDTLTDVLDSEGDMVDMYLTHMADTGEYRDEEDIEEINNILEAYLMQAENMLSEVQKLRDSIDQSESIILINLDSQRNVMMRLSLQLEMGVFSATLSGLIGMAFGMNLDSSLEGNPYAFWVTAGCMMMLCGLVWRRLLNFLFSSLNRGPLRRLPTATRRLKPRNTIDKTS